MAVETLHAINYVYQTLTADATFVAATPGGVWLDAAPEGTTTAPVCVLATASAPDLNTFNGNRVWSSTLLDVKISGPVAQMDLIQISCDRADVLLQRSRGGTVLASVRETVVNLPVPQLIAGQQWHMVVQSYRMPTQ